MLATAARVNMPKYVKLDSAQYHDQKIQMTLEIIRQNVLNPAHCHEHIDILADLLDSHPHQHVVVEYQVHIHELFASVMNGFLYIDHTDINYSVKYEAHKCLVDKMFHMLGCHLHHTQIVSLFQGASMAWGSGVVNEYLAMRIIDQFLSVLTPVVVQDAFHNATSAVHCYMTNSPVARAPNLAAKIETKLWAWMHPSQQQAVLRAKAAVNNGCWLTWHACNSDWIATPVIRV